MKRLWLLLPAIPVGYMVYVIAGLPRRAEARALAHSNPAVTAVMRQRDEEARRAGRTPRRVQEWVPLTQVSRHLVHAVLASEDQKFFGHEGVDWEAISKSVEEDRRRGRWVRGGSTITQQLAKNLFFSTHRTLTRKLRELVAAHWLEQDLTKARILELYLNVIEWGDGIYGCQAAARRYYGKPASALDATEAAGLAAMIPNPRRLNPLVDPRRLARAQHRVLWLMAHAGYLSRSGLGRAPPPELLEKEEEGDEPAPVPAATPVPEVEPEPSELPSVAPAEPAPTAPPTPEPSPTPSAEAPSPPPEAGRTPGVAW